MYYSVERRGLRFLIGDLLTESILNESLAIPCRFVPIQAIRGNTFGLRRVCGLWDVAVVGRNPTPALVRRHRLENTAQP